MCDASEALVHPDPPARPHLGWAVFIGTSLCLLLLGGVLGWALPSDAPASAELWQQFLDYGQLPRSDALRPEHKERTIFVVLVLCAPLLALGCARWLRSGPLPRLVDWAIAGLTLYAGLLVASAAAPVLHTIFAFQDPRLPSGLFVFGLAAGWASQTRWASRLRGLALSCVLATALLTIIALKRHGLERLTDSGPDEIHLESFLFTVAQAAGRQHCLVDYPAMYGCYGEIIAPAVRALGSTLSAVALIMIGLSALGFGGLVVFLRATVRSRVLAISALAALVTAWMAKATPILPDLQDHYYQFAPLRTVFPSLALVLGLTWRAPSYRSSLAFGAFSAIAVLWNPDSGIAAASSLLAVIALDLLPRPGRPPLRTTWMGLGAFAAAFMLTLGACATYLRLAAGAWPSFAALLHYPRIYFQTGWLMAPLPLEPSCWQLVVGIDLALIIWGMLARADDRTARAAAQLGVLGLGTFTYYMGRSHASVLHGVSWPAFLGCALLIDRLPVWPLQPRERALTRGALSGAIAMAVALTVMLAYQRIRWPIPQAVMAQPKIRSHFELIERTSEPSTAIAVLAIQQAVLLLHTGRAQALTAPGLAEIVLRRDLADLNAQLASGRAEVVYVDRDLYTVRPFIIDPLQATLLRHYERFAVSADGRLEAHRRRSGLELRGQL